MDHQWHFFRSGGFDQVKLDSVDDLRALASLDQKLWAALACPTRGLEFDERTLAAIDTDQDGRIRAPEVLAAVAWALARLSDAQVLFNAPGLPLSALAESDEEGRRLRVAAHELLARLGRPVGQSGPAPVLQVADTSDLSRVFPPEQPNGDGLVPVALTTDPLAKAALTDLLQCLPAETDRSGEPAASAAMIDSFFAGIDELLAWQQQEAAARPAGLGDGTAAALDALLAVEAKIEDYFMRSALAAFDERAGVALNGSEAELSALASLQLTTASAEAQRLPLARVLADQPLGLASGVNPAWRSRLQDFRARVMLPLLGQDQTLDAQQWQALLAQFVDYRAWRAAQPQVAALALPATRWAELGQPAVRNALHACVQYDLSVSAAAEALVDLDKLVRYQRDLLRLLHNFVTLSDFYTRQDKAIFQAGTLYIDGRSCDLCVRVDSIDKHAAMAGLSSTYLVYCECTRSGSAEVLRIVAAVTAGEAGNLMVGRNGIFYDRAGRDWDAHVVRLVENAISVREAFWSPYRRISSMISNQLMKLASERDKAVEAKASEQIGKGTAKVQEAASAPPTAAKAQPTPFDVGRFAGIFAAIGLALGALGTAIASVISGFLALPWWQMPLALAGILLLISGPAMVVAWFKLRRRNLAPILDANGWAVNTRARLTIRFGTTLTALAELPKGSARSLRDPYA